MVFSALLMLGLARAAMAQYPSIHNDPSRPPPGPTINPGASPPAPTDRPSAVNPASVPLTESLGIEAAKVKATRAKKFLLIFWCADAPDSPDWTFARSSRSISLRAYVKWHCIAIQARTLPPAMAGEVCRRIQHQDLNFPVAILVRDGLVEEVIGTPKPGEIGFSYPKAFECPPTSDFRGAGSSNSIPGPMRVLHQMDFALERIRGTDPIWASAHDNANPAPRPPSERELFSATQDEFAPVVRDPKPDENLGVLDRLEQARVALKAGDLYQATGLYSWLWERGSEFDPSFRAARLSAVAQDIAGLIAQRRGARERFDKIRAARTERVPWADHGQMHEWFVLNAATGAPGETIEYLDYFTSDADDASLAPATDTAAFGLLAGRENFAEAWQLPKSAAPATRVAAIVQRLNPKFPSSTSEAAREEYHAFARQYLLDEGSRLYAACLLKRDESGAQEVARAVLAARNDAAARLSLITTALATEPAQPRAAQIAWLDEAEAAGGPKRPDLRKRLMPATDAKAKP